MNRRALTTFARPFSPPSLAILGLLLVCLPLAAQEQERKPAYLVVRVRPYCEVEIEGAKTRQTGESRRYVSPPLAPGRDYVYTVKARWIERGRIYTVARDVVVRGGEETVVDLRDEKYDDSTVQVIWVPTPPEVVSKMLELAQVGKEDVVYDLGCGDGRILIAAARKGARGVGVDIEPEKVKLARANADKEGFSRQIEIRLGDALKVPDLDRATVVTLYMLPEFNQRLEPILRKTLKPGTRVVSHNYPLGEWKWLRVETVSVDGRDHYVFYWKVGETPE
jgi:uncharacterized protein (TIGR03000 family)